MTSTRFSSDDLIFPFIDGATFPQIDTLKEYKNECRFVEQYAYKFPCWIEDTYKNKP